MKPTLYILTDERGFFGQQMMPWEGIDLDTFTDQLQDDFHVQRVTYEDIACGACDLTGETIIHASSQQPEYKAYIEDVLLYLQARDNRLVPSIHAVRSHENKGYQELHRRLVGLPALNSAYLVRRSEDHEQKTGLPAVHKALDGFGSGGVQLVKTEEDLDRCTRPQFTFTLSELPRLVRQTIGHLVRKYILRRSDLQLHGDYYQPQRRFVLQQFIGELQNDFKVLIFPDRAFVLKRDVRPGDFRASGSGSFTFVEPSTELLEYAHRVHQQFDEPYLSLDVVEHNGAHHLIEFQAVHFGPYTVVRSPFHFRRSGSGWTRVDGPAVLEEEMGRAVRVHLRRDQAVRSDAA